MDEAPRQLVWDQAGDTCAYCRLPQRFDILPFQIDHAGAPVLREVCYTESGLFGREMKTGLRHAVLR